MQTAQVVSMSDARDAARTTEAMLLEALRHAEAQIAQLTEELEMERRSTSSHLLQALEASEAQIAEQRRELDARSRYESALAAENEAVSQENTSLRVKLAECRMGGR